MARREARWLIGTGGAVAVILVLLAVPSWYGTRKEMASYQMSEQRAVGSLATPAPAVSQLREEKVERDKAQETPAPMIARTVSLAVMVKDVDYSRSSLDAILARHHGYAAQLNANTQENGPRVFQASLRIPASDLSSAVEEFKALGRVQSESQSGEDVTQQHEDLVNRLKTARETEERFRTILQQRTGNVADVLEVEEGIARVRGEIEGMESEQDALEHRVNYANIDISLMEEYKAQFDSPAASVSTRLHNSFVAGYHNACETLLGIVLFVEEYGPVLLIWMVLLGLPVTLMWRRYRRIHSKL